MLQSSSECRAKSDAKPVVDESILLASDGGRLLLMTEDSHQAKSVGKESKQAAKHTTYSPSTSKPFDIQEGCRMDTMGTVQKKHEINWRNKS